MVAFETGAYVSQGGFKLATELRVTSNSDPSEPWNSRHRVPLTRLVLTGAGGQARAFLLAVPAELTLKLIWLSCLIPSALNRSGEFASRPGVCPIAWPEPFSPSCTLDTDCSGLQKCCSWPGGRHCVSPTPTGRGAKSRVSGRCRSGEGGSHSSLDSLELGTGQTGDLPVPTGGP